MSHPSATKPQVTIEQIRAFKWVGDHSADSDYFNAIDDFVHSDAPMVQKREALLILDREGMGIPTESISEHEVEMFLEESRR